MTSSDLTMHESDHESHKLIPRYQNNIWHKETSRGNIYIILIVYYRYTHVSNSKLYSLNMCNLLYTEYKFVLLSNVSVRISSGNIKHMMIWAEKVWYKEYLTSEFVSSPPYSARGHSMLYECMAWYNWFHKSLLAVKSALTIKRNVCACVCWSVVSDSLWPHRL